MIAITLILLAFVFYQNSSHKKELQKVGASFQSKVDNLIQYNIRQFPILRIAFKTQDAYHNHLELIKHRNFKIQDLVRNSLLAFDIKPCHEMVQFHIENNLSNNNRTAHYIHDLYRMKNEGIDAWDNLNPKIRTQLMLINIIATKLKMI